VEERRLGPVVGLGTYRTFEADRHLAEDVVGAAHEAGTRTFDSSPMYGSEDALEAASEGLGTRDRVAIATKIWASSVEEARQQYAAQRRFFGRVEIEQVHNLVSWKGHLPWLREARERGEIDRLGVTHWSAASFGELEEALETGAFDTVQIPLNPLERDCERRILPLAADRGIAVIVMRPFGGSGAPLLGRAPRDEELVPLRPFGVQTWAQALLKWVLSDPRVDLVIPATSRPERAVENATAGSGPRLGPNERALVERLAVT
jgi:diketogulonate reductase-like aldo/keto reductase